MSATVPLEIVPAAPSAPPVTGTRRVLAVAVENLRLEREEVLKRMARLRGQLAIERRNLEYLDDFLAVAEERARAPRPEGASDADA